ncbi:MAG: AAA family ATPase, partial [Planctomycetota bacterium]
MYREFFGLRCRPFEDRADARFFYATPDREEALAVMEYEARYGERMALVVGEAGTGKTLLIRALLGKLTPTERAVVLTWTTGDDPDLVRETAKAFGLTLPAEDVENREQRALSRIRRGLSRHVKEGRRCILIIDQAENLTPRNLSQLSMLSDLHHQGTRLLNIILVGQPPLRHLLQRDEFATLSQQVYGAKTLAALSTQETIAYIRHRMQVAGSADPDVFDEQAARLIHEASQGLPRIINRICEASLVAAYGASSKTVTCDIVRDVIATCGESMRETAPSSKGQDASLAVAPSQQTAAEPTADTVALVDDRELRKIEQAISRAERIAGATDQAVTRSADVEQKLSALLADAERVIATASESVRLSTQSCEDLEQRLVDLGERAQSQCGTIESQIAAARAESGVLLERVRGLQQVCAQAQEIEDRLQTFARGLASKADLVQERTTALMSAVESGREEQARLTESIAQAHSVKQDVQEAATAVRAMMAEARAESERFKEAFLLEIKRACRDQLEAMFREVEQEKKAAIQRTLADYDAQAKQLLERTKREHEAIRRQHADDVQRHAQWRREWEQEIGRVRQEIDQRIVSLRKTIDETAARHDELRSSVGFVMNDIAEATKRVETLSGRARRCTEEAQAAVAASQDVHGQLEESTSAARELVQQAGTASERLEAVCRRAADTLARIAEASDRVAQLRPQAENAQ